MISTTTRAVARDPDVAQDAEVGEGDHRQLGVGDALGDRRGRRPARAVTTWPPGARGPATACTASTSASSSVCTPCAAAAAARRGRPPGSGRVSVARAGPGRAPRRTSARGRAGSTATPAAASRARRRGAGTARPAAARRASTPACARRCDSSVPSPRRSTQRGGVVAVVGQLVHAPWRRWRRAPGRATRAAARTAPGASAATQQPGDGLREVAVGRPTSAMLRNSSVVAEVGERVLVDRSVARRGPAGAPTDPAREQQQPRLAEQVERDVGDRDLLLELRRRGDPLGQPLRERSARRRRA